MEFFKYGVRCQDEKDAVDLINIFRKEGNINLSGIGRIWGIHMANSSRILQGFAGLTVDRFIKVLRYFGYALYVFPLSYNPYTGEPEDWDIDKYKDIDDVYWDIENEFSEIYKEKKNNPD